LREVVKLGKKHSLLNKILIIGIILLFIVISAFPIARSITIEKKAIQKTSSNMNFAKGSSGVSLITLKLAGVTANDWYGNDNSFNFSFESDEIAEIYYGIDGNWSQYNETFNVSDGGEHYIEWYAVDHLGNQSEIDGPFFFKVDKTPPEISLSYEVSSGNPIQGWEFTFTATAIDSMSGMDRVEFYLNDVVQETVTGLGPEYSWSLRYWPLPTVIFWAKAYDKAGNSEIDAIESPCYIVNLKSYLFNRDNKKESSITCSLNDVLSSETVENKYHSVDEKLPSNTIKGDIFDPGYVIVVFNREFGKDEWIVDDVFISIFYELDRIDGVYYQINNEGWMLYTNPMVISEDGLYVFSWYVVDSEGNTSNIESISFKVDLTPPELNLIKEKIAINKVKFTAEVFDETSGIDRVRFQSRLGYITDYEFPYEWIWTGLLKDKVTVTVYDNAENSNSKALYTGNRHGNNQQSICSLLILLSEKIPLLERLLDIIGLYLE
jgi:hypothetical protein